MNIRNEVADLSADNKFLGQMELGRIARGVRRWSQG